MNEVCIDRWTWATRIFKTRTIAAEACKKGRIIMGEVAIKSSRMIKVGGVIQVRRLPITFSFKIIELIEDHVGVKLVPNYLENMTTPDQYEIPEINRISGFVNRAKDLGRPTKKSRRELEQFIEPEFTDDEFDFEFDFREKDKE